MKKGGLLKHQDQLPVSHRAGARTREEVGDRLGKYQRAVLSALGVAGVLAVGAIAPNVIGLISKVEHDRKRAARERSPRYIIDRACKRLIEAGFVRRVEENGGTYLRLTEKGSASLTRYMLDGQKIPEPKRWDGHWRMVIYDIPESRKGKRNMLQSSLAEVGFIRLQDSVWVYPHEVAALVVMLKAEFRLGKDVLYLRAESIEHDAWLRRAFNLPAEL
ncbi:MAG TPA: hypothetical protein VLB83_05510 [Candidatus Paceibacterota bacterium]|nr:hypothetical protein [Candidatus Paceibacterota bacterium]